MGKKKRKREPERPIIHPRNKYSDNPPDFARLASLYHSFEPFVFYTRDGRPRIDWTNFNATRELTRALLLHDHGLNWWIPDGQLCPTVPNRSNYIHWIEDLLSSDIIPKTSIDGGIVRGFDIGTGANCIYPLLGSSLLGWSFVGSDMTDVALEWAEKNVKSNPHISELIEIRRVESCQSSLKEANNGNSSGREVEEAQPSSSSQSDFASNANSIYQGPPILLGMVQDGEKFDFCMCNPPFFETMEEAGLNPKTSCGGTPAEMVCPGGEKAFITRIIEESVVLKQTFRWYSAMVGRKLNLKILTSKLWEVGTTVVKTTVFVQGQTCRWGLAWTFVPPSKKLISPHVTEKKNLSFMLEGVQRQSSAIDVLCSIESFFNSTGASCKLNSASFTIDITASKDHCDAIMENERNNFSARHPEETSATSFVDPSKTLSFRISVFQQIPGTLLVKGSIHNGSPFPGLFSSIFQQLEADLISRFCREKTSVT